jgi:hypothetical protein
LYRAFKDVEFQLAKLVWSKNEVARRISRWGSQTTPADPTNRVKKKKKKRKGSAASGRVSAKRTSRKPDEMDREAELERSRQRTDDLLERRKMEFETRIRDKLEAKADKQSIVRNDTPEKRAKRLERMAKRREKEGERPSVVVEKVKRRRFAP